AVVVFDWSPVAAPGRGEQGRRRERARGPRAKGEADALGLEARRVGEPGRCLPGQSAVVRPIDDRRAVRIESTDESMERIAEVETALALSARDSARCAPLSRACLWDR